MTPHEVVLSLLFKALDEPDALPVFGDALMEYGHEISEHVAQAALDLVYEGRAHFTRATGAAEWFLANASQPTPTFTRALAAALLCSEWGTTPWCVDPRELATGAELDRLGRLYGLTRMQGHPYRSPLNATETDQAFRERLGRLLASPLPRFNFEVSLPSLPTDDDAGPG